MTTAERPEVEIQDVTPVTVKPITVTDFAASKIKELISQRGLGEDHALRVFVAGGGCSGMQYGMAFENDIQEFDTVVNAADGVKVVIDATSMMYLEGAIVDFVDSLMGGGFRIENPNATSSCGCGHSFRTEGSEGATDGGCSSCG